MGWLCCARSASTTHTLHRQWRFIFASLLLLLNILRFPSWSGGNSDIVSSSSSSSSSGGGGGDSGSGNEGKSRSSRRGGASGVLVVLAAKTGGSVGGVRSARLRNNKDGNGDDSKRRGIGFFTGGRLGGSNLPRVTVDEEIESEDEGIRERKRGGWTLFDGDTDPVVSVINSVKDLFPNIRFSYDPSSTLKIRKRFFPLKTVLTLGADYNTNLGVWQFRSSWEDSIIGGRLTIAGRELMLTKSWLVKLMDSEDMVTRLKFRAALNSEDWTAYAKFGFRTERISPLNVREGFSLCKRVPLDMGGHAKLEVVSRIALPEPEIQFSTDGDSNKGVLVGMGDVHVGIDELNVLLEY